MGGMNEIDKLRHMLDEAKIPYESYIKKWNPKYAPDVECEADTYMRNQVVYGRREDDRTDWVIDAIYVYGSFGRFKGLLETYGKLGADEYGGPATMTAEQVFKIIEKDWRARNEEV